MEGNPVVAAWSLSTVFNLLRIICLRRFIWFRVWGSVFLGVFLRPPNFYFNFNPIEFLSHKSFLCVQKFCSHANKGRKQVQLQGQKHRGQLNDQIIINKNTLHVSSFKNNGCNHINQTVCRKGESGWKEGKGIQVRLTRKEEMGSWQTLLSFCKYLCEICVKIHQ